MLGVNGGGGGGDDYWCFPRIDPRVAFVCCIVVGKRRDRRGCPRGAAGKDGSVVTSVCALVGVPRKCRPGSGAIACLPDSEVAVDASDSEHAFFLR